MTKTTCHISISLDGFVAGPDQDRDNPAGVGGLRLHEWHWHAGEPGHEEDAGPRDELMKRRGAYVMGRNMFGPIRGEWREDWRGWWGEEPPTTRPCLCSPTIRATRSRCREGRPFTSSRRASTRPCGGRGPLRATATWTSPAAPQPCARRWRRRRSTSLCSTSFRSCWVRVSAFSRASRIRARGRLKRLTRRTPPRFATASGAERAAP